MTSEQLESIGKSPHVWSEIVGGDQGRGLRPKYYSQKLKER